MTPDEIKRHRQEYRRKALEGFPFKLIETTGAQAFAKWKELKSAGQGVPVVLGGDDETHPFENLLTPFGPNRPHVPPPQSVEDILRTAASIRFPDDLAKRKKAESEAALARLKAVLVTNPDMALPHMIETRDGKTRTYTREETIAMMEAEPHDPPIGEWPAAPDPSAGLSVAHDIRAHHECRRCPLGRAACRGRIGDHRGQGLVVLWFGRIDFPAAAAFSNAIGVFGGKLSPDAIHKLSAKYGRTATAGNRKTVRGDFGIGLCLALLGLAS